MTNHSTNTGRHQIALAELNTLQRKFVVDHVLQRLGSADGLAEDNPAIPYTQTSERLRLSELAAWQLGLTLTPGHEITQCYGCADILDAALTGEDAGIIRCPHCPDKDTVGERYTPDTSFDYWPDLLSY